jgi:hypothetical protein
MIEVMMRDFCVWKFSLWNIWRDPIDDETTIAIDLNVNHSRTTMKVRCTMMNDDDRIETNPLFESHRYVPLNLEKVRSMLSSCSMIFQWSKWSRNNERSVSNEGVLVLSKTKRNNSNGMEQRKEKETDGLTNEKVSKWLFRLIIYRLNQTIDYRHWTSNKHASCVSTQKACRIRLYRNKSISHTNDEHVECRCVSFEMIVLAESWTLFSQGKR